MPRDEIKQFYAGAEETASRFRERLEGGEKRVMVLAHWDADGIASAAIFARYLNSVNAPFLVRFTKPLGPEEIAELEKEDYEMFIFLDQGSGQLETIHRHLLNRGADAVVIDHHPGPPIEHPNLIYFNPHLFGLNGGRDISASGTTYSVIESLDVKFRSLVGLAIAGAIGDRQEFSSEFMGVNAELLRRAVGLGLVHRGEGLRLTGRTLWPADECLRLSTRPYILGLSGNMVQCRKLLESLDIPPSKPICEIGLDRERALAEAILNIVPRGQVNEDFKNALWGSVYTRTDERMSGPRDLREYAVVLDACGTMKVPETGFTMAAGRSPEDCAIEVLKRYEEEMLHVMRWSLEKLPHFKSAEHFRYLMVGREVGPAFVGEAMSLLIESGIAPIDVPLLAIAEKDGEHAKVSARGTIRLSERGFDLGRALAKSAAEVGGYGSGHDVAAAATIPKNRVEEFLNRVNAHLKARTAGSG
ncbi:MAG: DHH family phosphoesterase [Candidatus Hadarchaeales archaeon]